MVDFAALNATLDRERALLAAKSLPVCVIDFETYSEISLPDVGAWRYAEDPSTDIICMSYGFLPTDGSRPDPAKTKIWCPLKGEPFPQEVLDHIAAGGYFEAFNAQFERAIWICRLLRLWGIPMPTRWRDAQAVCAYRSLPTKLDAVCDVLPLTIKKDKAGKALLKKLSEPQKATKKSPGGRLFDEVLLERLYEYCITDTNVEMEVTWLIGDLPDSEQAVWAWDQKINQRGVHVDLEAVGAAKRIVAEIETRLTADLAAATNFAVLTGKQTARMGEWLQSQGLYLPDVQADTITRAIRGEFGVPSDVVLEVLNIRQSLAKASTAKLDKFLEATCFDGQCRGLLQYHGAGTGRWAGRLVQPQNFPRGTIDTKPYGKNFMDIAIAAIKTGDADLIEVLIGPVMEVIAQCLRGMFIARPGKRLYVADFAAIEARITMWFCRQLDAIEIFRLSDAKQGPDIYCSMATDLYDRPVTKEDKDERQLGKITVLGCFAAGTPVLTARGWIAIENVQITDTIWDGEHWTTHDGVIYQGEKSTISPLGLTATPDHDVLTPGGWNALSVAAEQNCRRLRSGIALANSWWRTSPLASEVAFAMSRFDASVDPRYIPSTSAISAAAEPHGATLAPSGPLAKHKNDFMAWPTSYPMTTPESVGPAVTPLCSLDVMTPRTLTSPDTAAEESLSAGAGMTDVFSSLMSRNLKDGITPALNSIDEITTAPTRFVTHACRHVQNSAATPAGVDGSIMRARRCAPLNSHDASARRSLLSLSPLGWLGGSNPKSASTGSTSLGDPEPVYDILNAGPNHRFTVLTSEGPIIVSNCGYQMGPPRLREQALKSYNVELDEPQSEKMVYGFRDRFPKVTQSWYDINDTMVAAIERKGSYQFNYVTFEYTEDRAGPWMTVTLPSGRNLWYSNPQIEFEKDRYGKLRPKLVYEGKMTAFGGRWGSVRTYGGMMLENIVQAIARDCMVEAMVAAEAAGYPAVLSVHDEGLAETEDDFGSVEEFERLMSPTIGWAPGLPVVAEGFTTKRYRK